MFERGELGHFTPLIFDPLIHIPLVVSQPGQKGRQDIRTLTSNVDLLPTLAHLANLPAPSWAEGEILPGLGGVENPDRSIFTIDAKGKLLVFPFDEILPSPSQKMDFG